MNKWIPRLQTIIAVVLFAFASILFWFVITAFSQSLSERTIAIAALTTMFAAFGAFASLLQAVEMRKQREMLDRPYIIADFETSGRHILYFVVSNFGNSPAKDIKVKFEPPPIDYANRPLNQLTLFSNPIDFLAPGKEIKQIIRAGLPILEKGVPANYQVSVSYKSIYNEKYDQTIEFDLEYLKTATLPIKTMEESLDEIHKSLNKLLDLLNSVKTFNAFLVESPEENQARLNRMLEERKSSGGK